MAAPTTICRVSRGFCFMVMEAVTEAKPATQGSWLIPAWVFLHRPALTPTEKLIMGVVCSLDRLNGCKCSNRYIGEQIGVSANAVRQSLIRIRKKGAALPSLNDFPRAMEGARIRPAVDGGVSQIKTGGCLNLRRGGVSKRDTDGRGMVFQSERELGSEIPGPETLADSLVSSGYPRQKIIETYEAVRARKELTLSAAAAVRDWAGLVLSELRSQELHAKRMAGRGRAVSQEPAPTMTVH